ncbi:hypothetical protein EXIGLDRAFT_846529 [Exidia glandulosa HHB12029]|uniref:Fungal-type protein kinase domain-containing protein n=1 Tax=Exidia glandulosa HHB12029 TaxID=1314781 RepID=A0A165AVQ1_EXIGL|nr:hypothetical protein EXIGLDRAFT_846529 [Exidia glandulosa HHB12029]
MAESSTSQLLAQPSHASKDRQDDGKAAPAHNVSPYVANILESSVRTAIEEDVAVTSAHRELASRQQSNNTQPYATFLLTPLSLSASTNAASDDIDDQAVLSDPAVHHIARGDACTPAVQVPLRELRQTVRDTMAMVELAVKAQGGESVQEGVPCIEQILTGDVTKEPCALLADLDHSAEYKYGERIATGARVRTGTPMFMACELSISSRDDALDYPQSSILHLESQLEAVDNLGDVFRRAFPDDDGTFMKQFRLVLEAEEQRRKTNGQASTNPKTPHLPRHDVESVFWVLVWSFARACPVGAPFEDVKNGPFSEWAHTMLKHTIGNEGARWTLLSGAQFLKKILHPDLAPFSGLLADIAAYLFVPWDLYHDIVDDDHVHIAIRRLLLAKIHAMNNNPTLDVQLNIMQPRVINLQSLIP